MDGVFTGVLDIYYAKMTTDDGASTAPAYSTPAVLGKGISVTITPQFAEGKLDASNRRIKWRKKLTGYEIAMNSDNISPAVSKDILGRVIDSTDKFQRINSDTVAPNIALGFCATYDDGSKEYWWLYHCNCEELNKEMATENSDGIEYQTPTINAVCVPRLDTGDLAAVADSNDTDIASTVFSGWFSAVPV